MSEQPAAPKSANPFWVAFRWLEHGFAILGVLAFLSVIFHFVGGGA